MFFGVSDYGAFVAAIVLFLAIPGPGNLALINSTGKGGVTGGLMATSPTITPNVAIKPPGTPPLLVEVMSAKLPGPGMAKNKTMAATKAL